MSVRTKTILIMAATIIAGIAVVFVSSRLIILRSFSKLEQERAALEVNQGVDALEDDIAGLATQAKDWGGWDETYMFAGRQNAEYIRVNVNGDNLTNLRLSLLVYLNPAGGIIYSTGFNYKDKKASPIPPDFPGYTDTVRQLLSKVDLKGSIRGIVILPEGPMMVAAHQILKGDYSGPSRGIIIMGRFLNDDEVGRIAASTHLNVCLHRYDDARLPSDFQSARSRLAENGSACVSRLGKNSIAGYALINDINGNPALLLRVEGRRDIYRQGEKTEKYFLFSLFAVTVICGITVLFLLERTILSRLRHLSASVRKIGSTGEISSRVSLSGNDELAYLASSVNGMLSDLERSQDEIRKREALRQSEERYRGLVEHLPDAVLIYCMGKCMFSNAAGVRLLGAGEVSDVLGRAAADLVPPPRREQFEGYMERAAKGRGLLKMEEKVVRVDGALVDVEVSVIPFKYQEEDSIQVILRDITERKRFEERIIYLAYYDSLTGLPNRLLFSDRLGQAINTARRSASLVAVLFLDLDNFKRINDTLGHTIGDNLLKGVAGRLSGVLRASDTVAHLREGDCSEHVSRLGGDEFVVLLAAIRDIKDAGRVAQRVIEVMAQPFKLDQHELFITASMGISVFPHNGDDPDTLLKNADVAMYKAKDQGKNTYQFYTQSMNKTAYERLVMEGSLRTALQREEFLLHYQPQFEIQGGSMVGAEALVRWQHKERGMIPPGDFIPIAEENGLIVPIGEWVLRAACSQHLSWQREGLEHFRVAVNLSSYQFRQKTLVETVSRAISDHGIEPGCIELELTESMVMQDAKEAVATMHKLKDMGIAITIDDFGTGYSSLSYLKRFPLDSLKIDASFVRDITTDPNDAAITKTIIAMAHNLDLKVVAEGVETEAQLVFLRENGCDVVQGYLLSRPVPAEKLADFIRQGCSHGRWADFDGLRDA